ncbi:hypothetical protein [Eisenbergiella tayi]|uniref:PD-(D/E)XK nuclease family transposase n=1 Tax=Eisenbergiella tayi TaxID=1432052 RepID=A0A1E3UID1_9FIRM|nr:hypothetical protein [Eisenbergiella tayi]ODR47398.1 hypothetical protein BEI64_32605 [Eisenbergiella tayi]ODR52111.1 hypothetical protein BEI59_11385 [Eisenbergiella tayi]ODR54652.1 hypothetical protein BEI63_17075 [Eisenbergiella tayi]
MKRKTWISRELDTAGIKAQYDEHVKRILGSRQVLARILKGTIEGYRSYSPEEITLWIEPDIEIASVPLCPGEEKMDDRLINGENTESKVPGEGTITYDIRFRAFLPGKNKKAEIKLLINVEAQKKFYVKYRIVTRGIFYGARMLSEQLDREFSNSEYDKLSVIIICLNEKLKKGTEGTLHGFLNTLLSPEMDRKEKEESLERVYGMKMEYELGEELSEMCNLSEAIEENAIKKGKKQGLREGILLTKKVIKLSAEGMSEAKVAQTCGITPEEVHEILED